MSNEIQSYRDLIAWQKSFSLGVNVCRSAQAFPQVEQYGLASQMRRSAVSVAGNIAEGYGRGTTADYLRYLRQARGSLFELDTQLRFSQALEYLTAPDADSHLGNLEETSRVLAGLIRSLEQPR